MDLRQLEYFIYVAELGSFTQAARVLGVGQPALSRQVRRLEVEIRQTLFYRNGRGVSLTEAGKRLLAHGRTIQMQFEHARHDVEDARGSPVGRVTVGFPYAVGRAISVPFVQAFRQRYPKADLCITEGLTIHLYEWLLSGRVDIALLHDPVPSPSLDIRPIRNDELLVLGCRKRNQPAMGASIPLRKIADLPLIIPCRPHTLRMMIETQLANMGLKPRIALEVDAVATIVNLVAQGLGYAIATRHPVVISTVQSNLQMHRIVEPGLSSVLAMATSAERPLTTLVHRTAELLSEMLLKKSSSH
ncbi:LysR family transcriptional regulator [Allopusillimonas soli]|uniref:LysR family transcriptional regulator n=1 Tax=Allopusillimonas soli TaxID=659016 RepID=A0A853F7E0_9BURK|nr:LysR family transcriptional regulator [Allopusillimonas soli]NYT35889.1 LysR family transcriptional regulator [Allopusillimonas soli]TEA76252.1 LysR family transcriptional regulator [Allopusillimonas soli]